MTMLEIWVSFPGDCVLLPGDYSTTSLTHHFEVIAIQRYLSDPKHHAQTGSSAGQALDCLQLTLADNTHKIKVILHYALNHLVQRHELQIGSIINITKCSLHYDETNLSGSSVVVVQELVVTGHRQLTDQELIALTWSPDCSQHEKEDVPLTSSRGYFVSLWSSMEMVGAVWNTTEGGLQGLGDTREEDLYSIRDLAKKWNSIRAAKPAVLVRVVLKSRMIHYAKPNKSDKWPFQAHMLVADASGVCTAVFWNEMCPKFYHRITEGSLLLLKRFNVKKGFQIIPRFRPALMDKEYYDIDINLNSHHPESEVRLIDPLKLSDNVVLTPLWYKLLSRRQVGTLPDNTISDIVGVVTYVSRFEREPMINKHGIDSGGFWVRRWIHLRDGTSKKPFIVQLYRLAEGMKRLNIHQGVVLMLTNVRVIQMLDPHSPSQGQRHVFMTSTAESQVYIVNDNSSESTKDEQIVKDVLDWSESVDGRTAVERSLAGGYFNFPPLPSCINDIKSSMKDQMVISSEDWKKILTSFSYREGRQIMVQAMMVYLKLKNLDTVIGGEGSPRKGSPAKKRKMTNYELILDSDLYKSDQGIQSLGKGTVDDDTIPVQYTAEHWDAVKERLDFPATDITAIHASAKNKQESLEIRQVPYFTVLWIGLNTQILLQTILLCPHRLQPNTQFLDVLSGIGINSSSLVSNSEYRVSEGDIKTVVESARHCADKRFLLVLDCYKGDSEDIEIILNRAVAVADVT